MINPEQLAICRQRGHDPAGSSIRWECCKHCGTWTRTVCVVESREDEPPEEEQGIDHRLKKLNQRLNEK